MAEWKNWIKILIYSFAQRLLLGIAAGIIGPLITIIAKDLNICLDRVGAAISFSLAAVFIAAVILDARKFLISGGLFL